MKRKCQEEFHEHTHPYLPSLYNTACHLTNNQNDAKSLVRETLYKAYHGCDKLASKSDFRKWIFRILVKIFFKEYKNRIRQPQKINYDNLEEYFLFKRLDEKISLNETCKEDFIENLDKDDLKDALYNLPFQIRMVVWFNDVEGFSYNEIANIIDIKSGIVRSELYLGRKLLQRYLWKNAKLFRLVI